ncbi:uncharacterized protein LOC120706428 isoform X2 [Panicum virgatum]|uniref:uncharacterized protein LOC120706428 isoform X2 n=1 Tax=Panicum virgatum TaxID=38727 RepID=UPI0019D6835B|nr:uncharacterized protein LOC120706428 isoform X2 [Panicum virgatum]
MWCFSIYFLLAATYMHVPGTAIIMVPSSNCYTFDNESRLIDFTHLVGKEYEYHEQGSEPPDLVVEFCKDVQRRSQEGYIEFGRFVSSRSFLFGSGPTDYIQKFHDGDLVHCETTFEKMGRTAQVNIICGHCPNKARRDEQGCICSISYDERMCRVLVELAIPCVKSGPRVFKGFTVGFHPRSSEIVYNGLTQLGFEQLHHGFSFQTEQLHVSLYLTAMSSLADLVGKPTFKVNPVKGLSVTLTGSGLNGAMPTTLSPTVLNVDWRCEIARSSPYEVNILIPVEGYDPIEFTLTKECVYAQEKESDPMKGWATFGIISCIFIVLSTLLCCGGFIYKTRMEHLYGLDALPGMAFLSAFLDAAGRPRGYLPADNPSESHASQASWEHTPDTTQAAQRTNDRAYGSI